MPSSATPLIVVPVPRHGDHGQFLTYELVQPAPDTTKPVSVNPLAPPGAVPVAVPGRMNSLELWSTSWYPAT
ncbi:MAG: hypothetical protein QM784_02110 [Polyangiaceae bacterium]